MGIKQRINLMGSKLISLIGKYVTAGSVRAEFDCMVIFPNRVNIKARKRRNLNRKEVRLLETKQKILDKNNGNLTGIVGTISTFVL